MKSRSKMNILGMMSGTSMDAVDCILVEVLINLNNDFKFKIIEQTSFKIPSSIRSKIIKAIERPKLNHDKLDNEIGRLYQECASKIKNKNLIQLIAIHGQTIYHKERFKSIQIGNPKYLHEKFKLPVIYNFRKNDILMNGTGAPLMPFLDWLMLKKSNFNNYVLNIGGIANITYIPKNAKKSQVIGFDTGPGMSLIDESCSYFFNSNIDFDAKYSKDGIVNKKLLNELMTHPYVNAQFPKSTGRDIFGKNFVKNIAVKYYEDQPQNIVRTFVAFTAKSISININKIHKLKGLNKEVYLFISGGGINHPLLMEDIKNYTDIFHIKSSTLLFINPKYKEALLMAVLGYSKIHQIESNMPSVTGATNSVVLGEEYCLYK